MTKIFDIPLYPYTRHPDQDRDQDRPARHPVVIIGAGPVGLAAAIDLAMRDVPVVVLDDNDRVSFGSRAICFAKRTLEILDRLGCGQATAHGVTWNTGRVFHGEGEVYGFNLLEEADHKHPAFVNLQQYYLEHIMVQRAQALAAQGKPLEIRGRNRVDTIGTHDDHVHLSIATPEGDYEIQADWLIACDGANSPTRRMMGLDFVGRVFEDNFLIADVVMDADFPTERWFWFDPPFNRGQSALLHRQPDDVWRIDLQLGWDIDREAEKRPERVIPRLQAMLGPDVEFSLEWVSIYTFQCRRMEKFRHGRVIFAGDAAHQVSPFGARGANSGIQDADNLAWKLAAVVQGHAPGTLVDSYDFERVYAADENILNSTRATEFITPKSDTSRLFRDAVLSLAERHKFARPLVNSGRLSTPSAYDDSWLTSPDADGLPEATRPGAPMPDAPVPGGWLLDQTGGDFCLLWVNGAAPPDLPQTPVPLRVLQIDPAQAPVLAQRYLGDAPRAAYLLRPDQHIAARWLAPETAPLSEALARALSQMEMADA
ncbi:MAG: FAD-dependent oxidoreductase [Alphaproteobacteria bacterium]|jgi:3-(3-hydroxy-phenyl)propionate hydroxylase|nr:FAD-dependent oxidoreductase [Alphaproteobacteria bacterium]